MKRMLGGAQRQRRRQTAERPVRQRESASLTTAERLVKPTNLAWALADAAKPHMNAVERSEVHVSIGLGETFAAIRALITSAADKRIALPAELLERCHGWLDVHIGHEDERHLRGLVEHVLSPYSTQTAKEIDDASVHD
jgi:hypothetical protein